MPFQPEERVDIIAGSYKGQQGTYLAPSGFRGISARVRVDGDSRESRNLRLASLQAIRRPPPSPARKIPVGWLATTGRRPVSPGLAQSGDSMQKLLEEVRDIERRVRDLVLHLEAMSISGHQVKLDD